LHLTEISNGFMTAKAITKRLLSILCLRVHKSVVSKARHTILSELENISICFFFSHNYYLFYKNITIGVQNASPKKNTHHLKHVGVLLLHLIILITISRLLFLLTNLRFGPYEAVYTTIFTGNIFSLSAHCFYITFERDL
jgi:hypothetical protein